MAKYVCDFDQINKAGQELEKLASEMDSNVKSSQTQLDSNLVSWSGTAADTYKNSSDSISNKLSGDAENMRNFGAYIKEAASKIEAAEADLASKRI